MRKILIAGNWKMHMDRQSAGALVAALAAGRSKNMAADMVVCPPFTALTTISELLAKTPEAAIGLGAQNMYFEPKGAFTGEVSAEMLLDVGCRYVILGHSERRAIFEESSELVNKKTHAALAAGLVPIVCLGETLEEREAGRTSEVVAQQFEASMAGLSESQFGGLTIAYEPVWAIGTGKVATPEQAEEVHADLRKMIEMRYNQQTADQTRILYGGSVKPDNAAQILAQPNVDGALVGGASLDADSFSAIASAAA